MSDTTAIPPDIVLIAGPLLIGILFNYALFGALTVQVYFYYISFPRDRPISKVLVFGVYLLECAQTALLTHDALKYFGFGFGNMQSLDNTQLLWINTPMMGGIVAAIVQIFFAWRIHIIGRRYLLSIFIVFLALTQCCAAIIQASEASKLRHLSLLQTKAFQSHVVWLVGCVACDITIATSLSYFLWKSKSGFRKTSALIHRLIRLTIETGSITAANEIIGLVFFLGLKDRNYYVPVTFVLAKLYSNNMLVIFNSRIRVVGGRGHEMDDAIDGLVTEKNDILSRDNREVVNRVPAWRTTSTTEGKVTSGLESTTLEGGPDSGIQSHAWGTTDPISVHISVERRIGDDSDSMTTSGVKV